MENTTSTDITTQGSFYMEITNGTKNDSTITTIYPNSTGRNLTDQNVNSGWNNGGSFLCFTLECIFIERYRYLTYDKLLILSILLGIISFVGAVGNTMVIMVFARNRIKTNSTYFMLTLAIIDLMVCIIVIPGIIAREWRMQFYVDVFCKGLEFIRSLMIPSSSLILVTIAFDRFFLICMSTKEIMTRFTSKVVILMIMLLGICLGVPPALSVGLFLDGMETNLQFCFKSVKYLSDKSLYQYWYFISGIHGAMIVIILILYLMIFRKVVQQSNAWKNKTAKIFPKRQNTTGIYNRNCIIKFISRPDKIHERKSSKNKIFQVEMAKPSDHDSNLANNKTPTVKSTTLENGKTNNKQEQGSDTKAAKNGSGKTNNNNQRFDTNTKTMSDIKRRSTHVKTTKVLFTITLVYICSFLPTFLETNEATPDLKYLTYFYFVNNAANPIIYSFMNVKFREEAKKLYCRQTKT